MANATADLHGGTTLYVHLFIAFLPSFWARLPCAHGQDFRFSASKGTLRGAKNDTSAPGLLVMPKIKQTQANPDFFNTRWYIYIYIIRLGGARNSSIPGHKVNINTAPIRTRNTPVKKKRMPSSLLRSYMNTTENNLAIVKRNTIILLRLNLQSPRRCPLLLSRRKRYAHTAVPGTHSSVSEWAYTTPLLRVVCTRLHQHIVLKVRSLYGWYEVVRGGRQPSCKFRYPFARTPRSFREPTEFTLGTSISMPNKEDTNWLNEKKRHTEQCTMSVHNRLYNTANNSKNTTTTTPTIKKKHHHRRHTTTHNNTNGTGKHSNNCIPGMRWLAQKRQPRREKKRLGLLDPLEEKEGDHEHDSTWRRFRAQNPPLANWDITARRKEATLEVALHSAQ